MKTGTVKILLAIVSFVCVYSFNSMMKKFENNERRIISTELKQIGQELQEYIRDSDPDDKLPGFYSKFFYEVLRDPGKYYVLKEYYGRVDFNYNRDKRIGDFKAKDFIFSIEGITLHFDGTVNEAYVE